MDRLSCPLSQTIRLYIETRFRTWKTRCANYCAKAGFLLVELPGMQDPRSTRSRGERIGRTNARKRSHSQHATASERCSRRLRSEGCRHVRKGSEGACPRFTRSSGQFAASVWRISPNSAGGSWNSMPPPGTASSIGTSARAGWMRSRTRLSPIFALSALARCELDVLITAATARSPAGRKVRRGSSSICRTKVSCWRPAPRSPRRHRRRAWCAA